MSTNGAYWTEERILRLQAALATQQDDIIAASFIRRLQSLPTLAEKRELIASELPLLLNDGTFVKLWEGREIPMRLALRDVLLTFLHREGAIQNIPSGEPDTPDETAERERLAKLFGEGKPVSEIVIEDRGEF